MNMLEKHEKNNWSVTLWDTGMIEVQSHFTSRANQLKYFRSHSRVAEIDLPEYVRQMVYQMFDCHRSVLRLPVWLRYSGRYEKSVRLSYSRYMSCENAGLFYRPWSTQGGKVI